MKSFTCVLIFTCLVSCATIQNTNMNPEEKLTPGHGVLVLGLHNDWNPEGNSWKDHFRISYRPISGSPSMGFTPPLIHFFDNYNLAVLQVPEGDYELRQILMSNLYWDLQDNIFRVEPGVINYAGDIFIKVTKKGFNGGVRAIEFSVVDNQDETEAKLDSDYSLHLADLETVKSLLPLVIVE